MTIEQLYAFLNKKVLLRAKKSYFVQKR